MCALGGVNSFVLNLLSSKFVSLSVTINSKAGTYFIMSPIVRADPLSFRKQTQYCQVLNPGILFV